MEPLYRLVYASRVAPACLHDLDATVLDILATSTRENAKRSITGLLIAHRGWFVQALEGPVDAVQETLGRIIRDPRHRDAIILTERAAEARLFSAWTMCAELLSTTDATVLELLDRKPTFDPADLPEHTITRLLTTIAAVHRNVLDQQHKALLTPNHG